MNPSLENPTPQRSTSTAGRMLVMALLAVLCGALLPPAWAKAEDPAPRTAGPKVFRYSFISAETGFDPAQISDLYSRNVTAHIFDALYEFDPLHRPYKIRPALADGMPQNSEDFRVWTVKLKPGIYFMDDAAFQGKPREVTAHDVVYSMKRFFDPKLKSPSYSGMEELGMEGMDELRRAALKGQAFDYDKEVPGLRALDRYTVQYRLKDARPRFIQTLADASINGVVAREVVEHYGDKIMEHPVGTGPFKLAQWRRSSFIVLEKNPQYREVYYDAEPTPGNAADEKALAQLKGRRLPMIDRVEVTINEESQPRWLAFLNAQFDTIAVPLEFAPQAIPGGKLAPNLAQKGIQMQQIVSPDRTLYYFNMEDPVVGGYTPEKVALRRAISLAQDVNREIRVVRRGQAVPAQSVLAPGTYGYDPDFKSENSDYDPARAKALLDIYGYKDRDGDGWREQPDGQPLTLYYASQPDALSRSFDEIFKKGLDRIGIRLVIQAGKWPEQLKSARAGKLMMWLLGYSASVPDSQQALDLLYGPSAGGQNLPRFKSKEFDEIYRKAAALPDGPERLALFRQAQRIVQAYVPHKYNVHRIVTDMSWPWLLGYKRPIYGGQFWQYIDIDTAQMAGQR